MLYIAMLGFGLIAAGCAHYLMVNGFPVPVQDASSATAEDMERINGPTPRLARTLDRAGFGLLALATALGMVRAGASLFGWLLGRASQVRPSSPGT